MPSIVLHNDTITSTGVIIGSVDGSPFVLDLGPGPFTGRIEWNVELSDIGGTTYAGNIQGSVDGSDPFFGMMNIPSIPPGTTDEILPSTFHNAIWTGSIAAGLARHIRPVFVVLGGSPELRIVVTLLDGIDVIPQTFPTPTPGANVYLSVPDLLLLLPEISPLLVSFIALDTDRQAELWVSKTARLEQEVVRLCQPRGSSLVSSDDQTTLWPRLNAFGSNGVPITPSEGVRDSWVEAMARYVDECAKAEILKKDADEPGSREGVVEIEADPEGAGLSLRYGPEGAPTGFFLNRQKILSLLQESFPFGGS